MTSAFRAQRPRAYPMSNNSYLTLLTLLLTLLSPLSFATEEAPSNTSNTLLSDTQLVPPTNPLNAHDLSPMGMYHAADWVVKAVMISLVIASVLTWAVLIAKQIQLTRASRKATKQLNALTKSDNLTEAETLCSDLDGPGTLLLSATQYELTLSSRGKSSEDGIKERVQLRLERVNIGLGSQMTAGTGILATVGSVGPFVGLFGTVWGIMNSFIGIAKSQSTSLAVVAPGIAEALLATAIGLIAAIPAVMIYNHFTRQIGRYKNQLSDLSVAIMVLVSRDLDRNLIQTEPSDTGTQLKEVG